MDISVLIVNYKTPELVKQCILSLLQQQNVRFEIIVVDNASGDDSLTVLRSLGDRIQLIENQDNKGFGAANNQAFKQSKGRYLFLLNPDAACQTENDLSKAVKYMDDHPEYGLVGTRIVNSTNQADVTAWDHYPRQKQTTVDFSGLPGKIATVLGASMIIRREAFVKVRGFDEHFFLYAEETDLCLRLRKQGYLIGYCEDVTVVHVGGASEKKQPKAEVVRRKKSAKYLFYTKHYPKKDVIKIVKHDLHHARWHLFRLSCKKLFSRLSERQQALYARHQVSVELARQCLKNLGK